MLTSELRASILRFDSCKIANAIESLNIRLKNQGFTRPGLQCWPGGQPAALGFAVTSKVKCAEPPMRGYSYYDLGGWWEVIQQQPGPTIAVIQDVDHEPGRGAVLSDVHAAVLKGLNCQGVITNGAIRNIPALRELGFPAFACHVGISHSYVHLVAQQSQVEILGLVIEPGDLIYADVHGAISIPVQLVRDIVRIAEEKTAKERRIIDMCRSSSLSIGEVRHAALQL